MRDHLRDPQAPSAGDAPISRLGRLTRRQGLVAAGLVAPGVPAAAITVGLALSFNNGLAAVVAFPLCYLAALLAEVVLGAPLFLVVWRLRLVNWWTCIAGGAAVGVAALTILQSFRLSDLRGPMVMGGLGAAAGLVFWLVARLGRDPAPADSLTSQPL